MTWSTYLNKLKDAEAGSRLMDLEYAELAGLYPELTRTLRDVITRIGGEDMIEGLATYRWLPHVTTNMQDAADQIPPGWWLMMLTEDIDGNPDDGITVVGCTCQLGRMTDDMSGLSNVVFHAPTRPLAILGAIVTARILLSGDAERHPALSDSDGEEVEDLPGE